MAELGLANPPPMSPTVSLPDRTRVSRRPGQRADGMEEAQEARPAGERPTRLRRVSRKLWPGFGRQDPPQSGDAVVELGQNDEYDEELVDLLDTIDPEVQALSTLTNVQNSLFVPDLGNLINRRPTYVLSQADWQVPIRPTSADAHARPLEPPTPAEVQGPAAGEAGRPQSPVRRTDTITSRLTESHWAALPPGRTLDGWSAAEKWELDDHVRHMLHSRRSKFKRTMKGFGQYVRRPLGFFVTLYATLITLFGLAWVLFLIGWIYVGEKQVYAIHVIDSVLVALFAIMGDGLAPFRAIDTYHMFFVVRYSRMVAKAAKRRRTRLRKRDGSSGTLPDGSASPAGAQLPPRAQTPPQGLHGALATRATAASEDRPSDEADGAGDAEAADVKSEGPASDYFPLTAKQRSSLAHHQKKLAKSHSFYKPHETFTHYSFPLGYLVAIVILLDCHSCLQISLGACTWGIDYHVRPFAVTTVILCVSITCNLTAGLIIMIGDRKTRKKDVMKLLNRQELTGDAIRAIEQRRKKEQEKTKDAVSDQTRVEPS